MNNDLTTPPHDERAEKSVLSSIINKPQTFIARAKAESITPGMFFIPAHSRLLSLILELDEQDRNIDPESVLHHLERRDLLASIGGAGGLGEIVVAAPTNLHFVEHCEFIRDTYARRVLIQKANAASQVASDSLSAKNGLQTLEEGVEAVRLITARKSAFTTAQEAQAQFLAVMNERLDGGALPGLETGIYQIDEIGGGMRKGELWVICGPTSGGKSVLSYQMCLPALNDGKMVLIFTLEMGVEEVFGRLISARGRINMGAIMKPRGISKGEGMAIKNQVKVLSESKLLISDEPNMTIDYICSQSEQVAEDQDVGLIVVDYIQLIDGGNRRGESREQELSRISKRLKQLAKKVGCPVITPAQLNDEGRLRESRAIGQDADVVLKIGEKGIDVSKFRNAPRNQTLPLALVGQFQRFETVTN